MCFVVCLLLSSPILAMIFLMHPSWLPRQDFSSKPNSSGTQPHCLSISSSPASNKQLLNEYLRSYFGGENPNYCSTCIHSFGAKTSDWPPAQCSNLSRWEWTSAELWRRLRLGWPSGAAGWRSLGAGRSLCGLRQAGPGGESTRSRGLFLKNQRDCCRRIQHRVGVCSHCSFQSLPPVNGKRDSSFEVTSQSLQRLESCSFRGHLITLGILLIQRSFDHLRDLAHSEVIWSP